MKKSTWTALLLCSTLSGTAIAADHQDGPQAKADPAADITDIYSWMADANTVALVMDVMPDAGTDAKFSDKVQYVFHTSSGAAYGATSNAVDIICEFDAKQEASCWIGVTEFVEGHASDTGGITSSSKKVRLFAGLRDDPFFFNLDGFKAAVKDVVDKAPSLMSSGAFHAADQGCPTLDANTVHALDTQLATAPDGSAAKDHFAKFNVLAIVLAVDKSLLTKGGPIIAVNGATYTK